MRKPEPFQDRLSSQDGAMIPHAGAVNKGFYLAGDLLEIDRGCQNDSVRLLKLLHNGCGTVPLIIPIME